MIRGACLIFSSLMLTLAAKGQSIDDSLIEGHRYLSVDSHHKIKIDTITQITTQIKNFESPWDFNETNDFGEIGYTNNMYSIAARGDSAIKPLLHFIETTNDNYAKIGAIYTIHLIGINRKTISRFGETFVDKKARETLLYLLKYNDLGGTIIKLLIRDPWLSDVPSLFSALNNERPTSWYLVNGLLHYQITGIPLNSAIPEKIGNLTVNFPTSYPDMRATDLGVEPESQEILHSIAALHNQNIKFDSSLFGAKLWSNMYYPIDGKLINNKWCIAIGDFLNKIAIPNNSFFGLGVSYGFLGNKIYYYTNGKKVIICSASTAKEILLNWWTAQSKSYKQQFNQDKAKSIH
jgi:hypothetical protein